MPKLPFGFHCPEDSPGFLLWQITMIWQRQIKKALEAYDISHPQFVILATLMWFTENKYDTTQVDIINWTKLDKMTVSQSLKKLENIGYVIRLEHQIDTRAKSVKLTTEGKKMVRKLVPVVESVDTAFFGQITKTEQELLNNIFDTLLTSVRRNYGEEL